MSETKTHWKVLANPNYLGSYSLMGTGVAVDLEVSIKSVGREVVTGADGKKDECTVAQMHKNKPFILNATNCKTLSKIFDTSFIEDWANRPFTIFVTKVKVGGEWVEALRIRPTIPAMNPNHPLWEAVLKGVAERKKTISDVKNAYSLTGESEKLLNAAIQDT